MLPDSELYVSFNQTAMQWGSNLNTSQDKMVLILNGYNFKHSEAAVAMVVPTIWNLNNQNDDPNKASLDHIYRNIFI